MASGSVFDINAAVDSMVKQLPIKKLDVSVSNNIATIDTGILCVPWRADAGIIVLRGRDVWSNSINAVYYISANYDATVTGPPTVTKIVGADFTISSSVVDLGARLTITMSQAISGISATIIK